METKSRGQVYLEMVIKMACASRNAKNEQIKRKSIKLHWLRVWVEWVCIMLCYDAWYSNHKL